MPHLNSQKGFAHVIVLLLLVTGLGVGLYLVSNPTVFKPKADVIINYIPETNFSLSQDTPTVHQVGQEFQVKLLVRSDTDPANLFTAKLGFPAKYLSVSRVDTTNSFVKNWVENRFDNNIGTISLIGGVPTPGIGTKVGSSSALMATITFKANNPTFSAGQEQILITSDSAIYRNTDNANIIGKSKGLYFGVVAAVLAKEGAYCNLPGYESSSNDPNCETGLICSLRLTICQTGLECDPSRPICQKVVPAVTASCTTLQNLIQSSFGSQCGQVKYDKKADLNKDASIDAFDYVIARAAGNEADKGEAVCKNYLARQVDPCFDMLDKGNGLNAYGGRAGTTNNRNLQAIWDQIEAWVSANEAAGGSKISVTDFYTKARASIPNDGAGVDMDVWTNAIATEMTRLFSLERQKDEFIVPPLPSGGRYSITPQASVSQSYPDFAPKCQSWQTHCNVFGVAQCWASFLCVGSSSTPSPLPSPQIVIASPSPVPNAKKGDGNRDGKISLVDLSVLLTNFGKASDFPNEIDLNNDGSINTFDYSSMIKMLLSLGIIVQ